MINFGESSNLLTNNLLPNFFEDENSLFLPKNINTNLYGEEQFHSNHLNSLFMFNNQNVEDSLMKKINKKFDQQEINNKDQGYSSAVNNFKSEDNLNIKRKRRRDSLNKDNSSTIDQTKQKKYSKTAKKNEYEKLNNNVTNKKRKINTNQNITTQNINISNTNPYIFNQNNYYNNYNPNTFPENQSLPMNNNESNINNPQMQQINKEGNHFMMNCPLPRIPFMVYSKIPVMNNFTVPNMYYNHKMPQNNNNFNQRKTKK